MALVMMTFILNTVILNKVKDLIDKKSKERFFAYKAQNDTFHLSS